MDAWDFEELITRGRLNAIDQPINCDRAPLSLCFVLFCTQNIPFSANFLQITNSNTNFLLGFSSHSSNVVVYWSIFPIRWVFRRIFIDIFIVLSVTRDPTLIRGSLRWKVVLCRASRSVAFERGGRGGQFYHCRRPFLSVGHFPKAEEDSV